MQEMKKNPRLRQQPRANSKPHSSAKEMSPSLNAGHGKNQPAIVTSLSGSAAPDEGPTRLDLIWGAENIAFMGVRQIGGAS